MIAHFNDTQLYLKMKLNFWSKRWRGFPIEADRFCRNFLMPQKLSNEIEKEEGKDTKYIKGSLADVQWGSRLSNVR